MPKDIERKIAVIFVMDVVGFSKSMERNEDQTLRSFRSCRDILDNLFEEHGGRIFNTAGDSVLAELPCLHLFAQKIFKSLLEKEIKMFLKTQLCVLGSV